jgi:hypothetical protein
MAGVTVVWVPGALGSRVLRAGSRDPIVRFAEEIALGLCFWPVLFLLTTSCGWSWSVTSARIVFAALSVALIAIVIARGFVPRKPDLIEMAALGLAAIVAYTRIRQIEGVVFPLWVDSVHHTMLVRLLVEHGHLPSSYAPFIAQSTFYYHWGFHAVVAFVAWVTGMTSPAEVPRLLLGFGQLLNLLTFFAVYCGGIALFRNRRTALLAATLATLVSLFPAYYVSWGRDTQLCGLLLLPPLASAFWKTGRHPTLRRSVGVAWLGGGLLLIHVRVAVVFAILAAILFIVLVSQRRWRGVLSCSVAGAMAVLIAGPWLVHLVRTPEVRTILAPTEEVGVRWQTSNAAPDDILWAPHNALLFVAATGGLLGLTPVPLNIAMRAGAVIWWFALVVLLQRSATRKRRRVPRRIGWRIAIVAGWVAVTALLINLDRVGLPRLRILPNSAAIIMLFLPVSIVAAHLLLWTCDAVVPSTNRIPVIVATLIIGMAGAATMLHIVNPDTVLATEADRVALDWIRRETPPAARFAVGVQPWIGGSFVGVDGGYWIPLVADRQSILPPGLYAWVMPQDRVTEITQLLTTWYEGEQTGNVTVLDRMEREGVTHLYFGPRNSTPLRQAVASSPRVRRVYAWEGVEIYALQH